MAGRVLRLIAIAIALAGVVDPAITNTSQTKPEVAIIAAGKLPDPALVERVAHQLESRFTIVRGSWFEPAATVSVGYQLPEVASVNATPAYAVIPSPRAPFVWIAGINAPARAHLHGDIPMQASVRAIAGRGGSLVVTAANQTGELVRVTRSIESDDESVAIDLRAMASSIGRQELEVRATIEGAIAADRVTIPVTIQDSRSAVLFFDRRPSWISTFARRVLESDPRFTVTSRVATTRGAGIAAGNAPESLGDPRALAPFRTIIVGAAQEMTEADAAGLQAFMRGHHGTVILLLDEARDSAPLRRLTGVDEWVTIQRAEPIGEPPSSQWFVPGSVPSWADSDSSSGGPSAEAQPAVWSTAFGSGRLIVSGALDAWRYRGDKGSAFDRYWSRISAEVAELTEAAERRGEGSGADGQLRPLRSATSETLRSLGDDRDLIRQWTSSRRGRTVSENELQLLIDDMARTVSPAAETRVFHPMRSMWWILPFGLALGAEWWLRRRSGRR